MLAIFRTTFDVEPREYLNMPQKTKFTVEALWDAEHRVSRSKSDIEGLVIEATTLEDFEEVLQDSAIELILANHWDGLQVFLTNGRVEIDSNAVENLIRPIALNRKNALFAGHDEGGKSWGRIASLIETAKINGIDPFAYLTSTLERIAQGHPRIRLDELLPWNFETRQAPM